MPFSEWTDYMVREVSELSSMGLIPVAAHIERYIKEQPRNKVEDLLNTGIMLQCNASFFLYPRTRRKAFRMLSDKKIDFIGSDAHNLTSRAPNMGPAIAAIRKKLGDDALSHVQKNENMLIEAVRLAASKGGAA